VRAVGFKLLAVDPPVTIGVHCSESLPDVVAEHDRLQQSFEAAAVNEAIEIEIGRFVRSCQHLRLSAAGSPLTYCFPATWRVLTDRFGDLGERKPP